MTQPPPHPSLHQTGLPWLFARFLRHSGELARLATPVVVSRAGIVSLALVDTVMLGPLGAEEVGRYGLGSAVFAVLIVVSIGLMFGAAVETSHLRGAGRLSETGAVWRRALPYATLIGLFAGIMTQFSEDYFLMTGQSEHVASMSASVARIHGISVLPSLLFVTSNLYLEAMGRPLPGMIAVWVANILNVLLNFWFIDGAFGFSGADGASLATAAVRFLMMFIVIGYVWYLGGKHDFGIRQRPKPGWIVGGATQRRHGYAAGPAYAAESGAFHIMHIFAGWMAVEQLTSFSINMNLLAMLFMATLGIGSASAVRVGVAHGRRDWPDRALAGWTGFFWGMAVQAIPAIILVTHPEMILSVVYQLKDPALIAVVAQGTVVIGLLVILDAGQFILGNALRATGDAWMPTALNITGFLCIMVPTAYWFGIHKGGGAEGLYTGVLIATALIVAGDVLRWTVICLRSLKKSFSP